MTSPSHEQVIASVHDLLVGQGAWFTQNGAHVIVDGQFGSTGKGVVAALVAEACADYIDCVTTNAGPNSGHTAYFRGQKIVTKQIPIGSVVLAALDKQHDVILNAGAVLEYKILQAEFDQYLQGTSANLLVSPHAAVIRDDDIGDEHNGSIASTGKGVGPAMIRKLSRVPTAVVMANAPRTPPYPYHKCTSLVEVSQGFSLGINSGFYPYVTTRECTVSQALSDMGAAPGVHRKTMMTLRTFPIRVGNLGDNSSGPCYADQKEITWAEVGVEPELTTVTKRERRVFTWSDIQFVEAIIANHPDVLFLNFVNYLAPESRQPFVENVIGLYREVFGMPPEGILLGFGPQTKDIRIW